MASVESSPLALELMAPLQRLKDLVGHGIDIQRRRGRGHGWLWF